MTSYTYLLQCADGSLYAGWTNDLEKRVAAHNAGTGAKYTRAKRPVKLVYAVESPDKQTAMQLEWKWKRMTHAQKLQMIAGKL